METSWPELYLRHFTRYLGKPFDVETYRREDGDSIRLATFDLRFKKHLVYASLGMSEHADALKDLGEVILVADDKGKDIPFLFVNALFFILQKKIALASHFAIGGIEGIKPDFAEHFEKQAIYFTLADGFPPGFERLDVDSRTGLVFQGLFISWAENDFINRKGWQEFEERLKAQEGDPCSLRRPSCV
jgi:hypothetical protein